MSAKCKLAWVPGLVTACLWLAPGVCEAIVYLNIQWDNQAQRYVTANLDLSGKGLALDRGYQNDYGKQFCLCSGPPFIIVTGILASTVVDPGGRVLPSSLTVEAKGAASDPCGLNVCPQEPMDVVFRYDEGIHAGGHIAGGAATLRFLGHAGDPVRLLGHVSIENHPAPGVLAPPFHELAFEHVTVDAPVRPFGDGIMMEVKTGNLRLEDSVFRSATDYWTLIHADGSYPSGSSSDLLIRGCRFEDNEVSTPIYHLRGFRSYRVEDNEFSGNDFNASQYPWLFRITGGFDPPGIQSIWDNRAGANSLNAIRVSGRVLAGEARIRTSEDLPLVDTFLEVAEDASLVIGDGSVVKLPYGEGVRVIDRSSIQVKGRLSATGAVFTSFADDTHGGDTDLQLPADPVPVGSGIYVHPGASLELSGCTLQHLEGAAWVEGEAQIRDSLFQKNSGAMSFRGDDLVGGRVERTTSRQNIGSGLGFRNGAGASSTLVVKDSRFIQNTVYGMGLFPLDPAPVDIELDHLQVASNRADGVYVSPGSNLRSFSLTRSAITSNDKSGFRSESGSDDAVLRLEGNVIAGNGLALQSSGGFGAWISKGQLELVNNTVAYNRSLGLSDGLRYLTPSSVINNLFYRNLSYGLAKDNEWASPALSHNVFWGNKDGTEELYVRLASGTYKTVESLQALGGQLATNQHLDPLLVPEHAGTISAITYDASTDESELTDNSADFAGHPLAGKLVNPNTSDTRWFTVAGSSPHVLRIQGDIRGVAGVGNAYRVFDPHLAPSSDLIDAGRNDAVRTALDIDGDPRLGDGDLDGVAVVDVAADEYLPGTPDIRAEPAEIAYEPLAVGAASAPQRVEVHNDGDGHLWIGTLFLRGPHVADFTLHEDACSGQGLAPGEDCALELVFAPRDTGERRAEVAIPSNDPDAPLLGLSAEGTGLPGPDTDGDGIEDRLDNCTLVANHDQRDIDADGYGNRCDPDFNNDGVVTAADYMILRARLNTADPLCDLNGDGFVTAADYLILRGWLNKAPGPSGLVP